MNFYVAQQVVEQMNSTNDAYEIKRHKDFLKSIGAVVYYDSYVGWVLSTRSRF